MRMVRTALTGAATLLVALHAWVLANQLVAGELADPAVVLRWTLAALIVTALAGMRRRGYGLFGRKSIAVWALAGLLHAPAAAGPGDALQTATLPAAGAVAVQVAAAASATLGLLLYLLAVLGRRSGRRPILAGAVTCEPGAARPHGGAWREAFTPRPPPLA
jgi:hypothetical protein